MIIIAVWIIAAFTFIQLGVLGYILIRKKRINDFQNRVQELYEKLLPPFIRYISGIEKTEPDLPDSHKLRLEVLQKILNGFSKTLRGESEQKRIHEIAESHLALSYREDLKSRTWSKRVNALFFIEDFHIQSLKKAVWDHLKLLKEEDEEFRQALRVLAVLKDERLPIYLFEKDSIEIGLMKELLRRFNCEQIKTIENKIRESSGKEHETILLAFISFCGEDKYLDQLPFVEEMLTDNRKEVRLKALKSISSYQYTSKQENLTEFFQSEHWEERMYAAKITGIMSLQKLSRELISLMSDEVWWVRFAAAEALWKLPDGEILLEFVANEHEDKFARDMARQTMTQGNGGMQ